MSGAATERRRRAAPPPAEGASIPEAVEFPFSHSPGYLISDAQRLIYRRLQARLVPYKVAAGSWFFLRALWQADGMTQRQLSQKVGIQEAATGAVLDKLEQAGFVRRVRNADDRRKINVFLTPAGRGLAKELLPIVLEMNEQILEGFSEAERGLFRDFLNRVRGNLGDENEPD